MPNRVTMKPERQVRGIVAHEPGVMASVDAQASKIGADARANLARHRDEGAASIEVQFNFPGKYGDIDALVSLVDPPHARADGSMSRGNAKAIEFGHFHNKSGEFVLGTYVLSRAAGLV